MRKKPKIAWPTKAVMNQIYEQHLWGGAGFDFYSGEGSHDPNIVHPYIQVVLTFLKSHNSSLSVCDLGCGDFNIGKHLTKYATSYIGVDIVDRLIERNKALFKDEHLTFQCLDISEDDLPHADCILLRQVLQHLSNSEIQGILNKLINYKYIIITEHIPTGHFTPNKDIISGQGNRLEYNSGVDVLKGPFNFEVNNVSILDTVILNDNSNQIVTTLFSL